MQNNNPRHKAPLYTTADLVDHIALGPDRYSEDELSYFEDLIWKRRAIGVANLERLREQLSDAVEQVGNDNPYGSHIADTGNYAREQENLHLMVARQKKQITLLDKALERIVDKTYGICKVTGRLIARERLEAIPHTEVCIAIKLKRGNKMR